MNVPNPTVQRRVIVDAVPPAYGILSWDDGVVRLAADELNGRIAYLTVTVENGFAVVRAVLRSGASNLLDRVAWSNDGAVKRTLSIVLERLLDRDGEGATPRL